MVLTTKHMSVLIGSCMLIITAGSILSTTLLKVFPRTEPQYVKLAEKQMHQPDSNKITYDTDGTVKLAAK